MRFEFFCENIIFEEKVGDFWNARQLYAKQSGENGGCVGVEGS